MRLDLTLVAHRQRTHDQKSSFLWDHFTLKETPCNEASQALTIGKEEEKNCKKEWQQFCSWFKV